MAGAPHPHTYMGWWGSLGSPKQKYITQYTISPYAAKPLKGLLIMLFSILLEEPRINFFMLPFHLLLFGVFGLELEIIMNTCTLKKVEKNWKELMFKI